METKCFSKIVVLLLVNLTRIRKKIQYLVNQVSQLNNENEDKNTFIAELNNKIHKLEKLN